MADKSIRCTYCGGRVVSEPDLDVRGRVLRCMNCSRDYDPNQGVFQPAAPQYASRFVHLW